MVDTVGNRAAGTVTGQRRAIGAHRLFHGAGLVLRCPACGDVAATITVHEDVHVIKLRGVWRMTGDG